MSMLNPLFDALDSKWFKPKPDAVYHMIWTVLVFPLLTVGWAVYFSLNRKTAAGEAAADWVWHLIVVLVLFILTLLACLVLVSFLRYVNKKRMSHLADMFATQTGAHFDLSKVAAHKGDGRAGEIVNGYNRFRASIRDVVEDMRQFGVKIAVDATKVNRNINHTSEKTGKQRELLELMTTYSSEASNAITEVSQSAQYVSDRTTKNLQQASDSFSELKDVTRAIEQINTTVAAFREVVDELNRNSASIMDIIAIINNISEQTNLLSLNATIEAARAGEHGRGFAVVAEEVRNLARRVKPATEQITENINTMAETVKRTMTETDRINIHSSEASRVISTTGSHFESMINDFEDTNDQLVKIAAAIEELSNNNEEIQARVVDINALSQSIYHEMNASKESVSDLHQLTEGMQQVVSGYRTGTGRLDPILANAHRFRDQTLEKMIQMHTQGVSLFDRQYREVANTNPQKYMTPYAEKFDRMLQAKFDNFLETEPAAIYALATDANGYVPTHHSKNARPMTGDFEVDLLHSRDKRIYAASESEVRRAKNTEPILMQTYMRDTGEILCEVSLPLVIDGRHWGAFIMGYTPPLD